MECTLSVKVLTCLRNGNNVSAFEDGRNRVHLDRSRLYVLCQLDVLEDDGVQAGILELLI